MCIDFWFRYVLVKIRYLVVNIVQIITKSCFVSKQVSFHGYYHMFTGTIILPMYSNNNNHLSLFLHSSLHHRSYIAQSRFVYMYIWIIKFDLELNYWSESYFIYNPKHIDVHAYTFFGNSATFYAVGCWACSQIRSKTVDIY